MIAALNLLWNDRCVSPIQICSRNLSESQAAARRLGSNAVGLQVDIRSSESVDALLAKIAETHGGVVDVLCVNAGVMPQNNIGDISVKEFDDVYHTNVRGTVYVYACMHACTRVCVHMHSLTCAKSGCV